MKFTSMLLTLATAMLLAASFDSTSAAECTTEQLVANSNASLSVQATKECSKFTATSSAADVCGNAKCLDAIKKAVSQFEDCTVAGMDVKKTLEDAIASCPGSSTTSASASTSTKASIVTVAATSVLAVVAMRL